MRSEGGSISRRGGTQQRSPAPSEIIDRERITDGATEHLVTACVHGMIHPAVAVSGSCFMSSHAIGRMSLHLGAW